MKAKHDDPRKDPRTERDYALTKKGIDNMSVAELREWTRTCTKMENWVRAAKSRRSWKESRVGAERRLESLLADDTTEA